MNHNLVYRVHEDGHCRFNVTTPKTKTGIHTVPMLSQVEEALCEEHEIQKITGSNTSEIDGFSGFVFTNRYGQVFSPACINSVIERIIKACNTQEELLV